MDVESIKQMIQDQGADWSEMKTSHASRLEALEESIAEVEKKMGRPGVGGDFGGGNPAERKSLDKAVRALLAGDQAKADAAFAEVKAMSVGSDPDGGYVVHDMISTGMTKVMAEISPLYRLARRITLSHGAAFEEPIDRESAEAHWVGETASRSDTTTPQLGLFRVELNEIYAMPKATQKLVDVASIDVLGWLQEKVGEGFAVKEGTGFHTGTGVAQPRGILTYTTAATADDTRAWGVFEHIPTTADGTFPTSSATVNPADVLVDVVSALKAQYRNGARWFMNRSTAGVVRKLKDAEGRHVWADSLQSGQPSTLLGYPVEIDEDMPDIASDALAIAFGNMKRAYTIVEGPGIKFLTDPFTDKPNVRLYSYRRVGGAANNSEALKFLKFSES